MAIIATYEYTLTSAEQSAIQLYLRLLPVHLQEALSRCLR